MSPKFVAGLLCLQLAVIAGAQPTADSVKAPKSYKNVIRYNLSGPLLFGSNYMVFGYERILNHKRSMSLNAGKAVLPKIIEFSTEDYTVVRDRKNTGINLSLDYRFYLGKENKFNAPRGVYLGPFYSFNRFERDTEWQLKNATGNQVSTTSADFTIHTIGAELGYQFVLWNRLTLDLIMIGPGISNYNIKSSADNNLSAEQKEKLQDAMLQMLEQKFPGMDIVLSDESLDASGNFGTWAAGYRYIFSIGFRF